MRDHRYMHQLKTFFAEKNRQITKTYKQFDPIHIKFKALKTVLCVV